MAKGYFDNLNYTLGNEDTALELEAMPDNPGLVLAVAGSGARVIPLFAKNPRRIVCVDSSREQLYFTQLRIASFVLMEREDYLAFWGFPGKDMGQSDRKRFLGEMDISAEARSFVVRLFEQGGWRPLLYAGRWERTFKKISLINGKIVGKAGLGIFDCKTMQEQADYLKHCFPKKAWSFSIFLLGNAAIFNNLLYKGAFPQKNIDGPMHAFYAERLGRLFGRGLARDNFFLQMLFFGELIYPQGLPIECDPEVYARAKAGARGAKIEYVRGDCVETAMTLDGIDFLSFSDVPSYFSAAREKDFLQAVKGNISSHGRVVNRYYLRLPEGLDETGYRKINDIFSLAIANEKTQMYSFGIYENKGR